MTQYRKTQSDACIYAPGTVTVSSLIRRSSASDSKLCFVSYTLYIQLLHINFRFIYRGIVCNKEALLWINPALRLSLSQFLSEDFTLISQSEYFIIPRGNYVAYLKYIDSSSPNSHLFELPHCFIEAPAPTLYYFL